MTGHRRRVRVAVEWLLLLGVMQGLDVMTTTVGLSRGGVESMPLTAAIIERGGVALLAALKAVEVLALAGAMLLISRLHRRGGRRAFEAYFTVVWVTATLTVTLAIVDLQNAALVGALSG